MPVVELTSGPIEYAESGDGPVIVFTHGFPMTGTQWRKVTPLLPDYRCILPTLPMGAHRFPMHPDADLGQLGQARILAEFLERLELADVTLVMNDWGGPQFLAHLGLDHRIGRMVFVSCEAFDNFPPAPARPLINLLTLPGGSWLVSRLLRTRLVRHHPRALGGLTRAGVPDEVMDDWFAPALADSAIRRDMVKFAKGTPNRATLLAWSGALSKFDRPALIAWGAEDSMMPREHAERLATLLPDAHLEIIPDAATLIPEDQPEALAGVLRNFLGETI